MNTKLLNKIINILLVIFLIYNTISISYIPLNTNNKINVEVRGEVIEEKILSINNNYVFNDLLSLIDLKESADLSSISLNMKLYNNQIIVIPAKSEKKLISINSARLDELITLPGIGEAIATRIIEYRNIYGCFNCLEDLKNVKGIGNNKYERIKEYIRL